MSINNPNQEYSTREEYKRPKPKRKERNKDALKPSKDEAQRTEDAVKDAKKEVRQTKDAPAIQAKETVRVTKSAAKPAVSIAKGAVSGVSSH